MSGNYSHGLLSIFKAMSTKKKQKKAKFQQPRLVGPQTTRVINVDQEIDESGVPRRFNITVIIIDELIKVR